MRLTLSSWLGLSYRSAPVSSVNAETTLNFCTSSNTTQNICCELLHWRETTILKRMWRLSLLAHFKYSSFWKKMAPVFHIIWWNSLSSILPTLCLPVWWSKVMGVLLLKKQLQDNTEVLFFGRGREYRISLPQWARWLCLSRSTLLKWKARTVWLVSYLNPNPSWTCLPIFDSPVRLSRAFVAKKKKNWQKHTINFLQ